ncbi:FTR1 family iron permease [Halobacillus salinus]|uniref:FTR1 family iron permease n=1 Tax=Halobacillus salinus TaxID=192814 RepID=UPI0015908773|nr:FTR1 family protein [Halobacillus salinus]
MSNQKLRKKTLILLTFLTIWSSFTFTVHAADGKDRLLPTVGDALVEVRAEDYSALQESLLTYQKLWEQQQSKDPNITEELTTSLELLEDEEIKQDALYEQIVQLASATDDYVSGESSSPDAVDHESIKQLADDLDPIIQAIKTKEIDKARSLNDSFVASWTAIEKPIRETNLQAYGEIETKMSMVRVSLNKDPLQPEQAVKAVKDLQETLKGYAEGKTEGNNEENSNVSLAGLIQNLERAEEAAKNDDFTSASEEMETFIQLWPMVEGQVLTKSQQVYNQTEQQMTEILTMTSSSNPDAQVVAKAVQEMRYDLEPFAEQSSYSAIDAFFILFREGLEAILVIATLLAYLRRTNNEAQRVWVWSGLSAGLLLSGGMAVLLTILFAGVQSGTSREMIEGITGLVAVVMMLTVGAWLHKQSNILAWNQFVNKQLQKVMNRGARWMLALVTFIAIFREGAETIIFYLGMAPSIELSQLLWGMGSALLVLIVIGFLLVKLSVRIPIRPFFLLASAFIYFIAFKFTGVSIHALQITDVLPVHPIQGLPVIDFFGFYPTWETAVPQIGLLAFIGYQYLQKEKKTREMKSKQAS